jgi:catechol 2,3-dioxygenase-like lactoylglutathione lyase family enzyme
MPVALNHTIVRAKDSQASASFLAEILGLPTPVQFGPFYMVETTNSVSLDFMETDEEIAPQHYAFLITEAEFDTIFHRIQERHLPYWADPQATRPNEINHRDGGRGLYFEDPNGHYLEILTRPYGSGR